MELKKSLIRMCGTVCAVLVLAVFFLSTPVSAEVTTLKFNWEIAAGMSMPGVWPFKPGGRFEYLLNKYTNGRLKLDVKEGLIGPTESILAVGDGRVDMGTQITAFCSGTYPLLDWGGVPGLITNDNAVGYEWLEAMLDPRMIKVLEQYTRPKGFIILGALSSMSGSSIWGKKPIKTLADFKGEKIRGAGLIMTKELEALGARAVSISVAEVEEALIRGTVDAVHTSLIYGCDHRFFDIVDYISLWPFTQPYPYIVVINAKKFDALPHDLQVGLRAACEQMSREVGADAYRMVFAYRGWAQSSRAKLVYADPAEIPKAAERMVPVIKFWLKLAGPLGPEVLRIASEYGTGPTLSHVKALLK